MYVGNVILLVLNLPLVEIWVKLLAIPRPLLYAGILIFATLGAYGLRNSWFDLLLLYVIGLIGFLMRRYDIPIAPVLVGMILVPLAEQQFRRGLAISQGDLSIFVTSPISATVLAITGLVLIVPPIWRRVSAQRAARDVDASAS
jgi:putative tricarboxylic transport membrane protein